MTLSIINFTPAIYISVKFKLFPLLFATVSFTNTSQRKSPHSPYVKHLLNFIVLSLAGVHCSHGQNQYLSFDFNCSSKRGQYSVVSIARRSNTELLGYLPVKGYTNLTEVKFKGSLADSIGNFFSDQSTTSDKSGVLILENFFLNGGSNPAKLILSMRFYSEAADGKYATICAIDTIYRLHADDPLAQISEQFCEISKQVHADVAKPTDDLSLVSRNDLNHLDSLEKLNIPMYVADKPASGIYKDYAHFKMNKPDINTEIFITISKKGAIEVDRTYKNKSKKVKLDPKGIYAVSDGNRILKVTPSGEYFEIFKHEFDFYYERPGHFYDEPNNLSPYYFPGGGRIGMTQSGDLAIRIGGPKQANILPVYRFKINYKKGYSIPVSLVK